MDLYIGVDLGTSGCRAVAIDRRGTVCRQGQVALPPPQRAGAAVEQAPEQWWVAVEQVLGRLFATLPPRAVPQALAVDGTSGTVLLADDAGTPLAPGLMYNDARATTEAAAIAALAPPASAAHGPSAGLAKLLWLRAHHPEAARAHTQADWICARLAAVPQPCDANNALKLGYDPVAGGWPVWLEHLGLPRTLLPAVVAPGTPLAPLAGKWAERWGLPSAPQLVAGTTDSTAAIIATGLHRPGEAVTSLGSTLVTKVLAESPIFAPEYGVYSQPYGGLWLVGGGSNSGGAVLRQHFTDAEMAALSAQLAPERPTGLDYYPLCAPGERFPVNDPRLAPRLTPRPAEPVRFFQGMLEGIARIERDAYRRLAELGAPYPERVLSAGGGAANAAWARIRARALGVPVERALHSDAAYGAALLARNGAMT